MPLAGYLSMQPAGPTPDVRRPLQTMSSRASPMPASRDICSQEFLAARSDPTSGVTCRQRLCRVIRNPAYGSATVISGIHRGRGRPGPPSTVRPKGRRQYRVSAFRDERRPVPPACATAGWPWNSAVEPIAIPADDGEGCPGQGARRWADRSTGSTGSSKTQPPKRCHDDSHDQLHPAWESYPDAQRCAQVQATGDPAPAPERDAGKTSVDIETARAVRRTDAVAIQ